MSIREDDYKPIIVNGTFNNDYIQYESKGDKDKTLTINEYLDMIRPYLVHMINDHKTQSEWKIQLTAATLFLLNQILMRLVLCTQKVITYKYNW